MVDNLPRHIKFDFRLELDEFKKGIRAAYADIDLDVLMDFLWSALWESENSGMRLEDSINEIVNSYSEDGYTVERLSLIYEAVMNLANALQNKVKELGLYMAGIIPYNFNSIEHGSICIAREDI